MTQHSVLMNLIVKADSEDQAKQFAYDKMALWLMQTKLIQEGSGFPLGSLLFYGEHDCKDAGSDFDQEQIDFAIPQPVFYCEYESCDQEPVGDAPFCEGHAAQERNEEQIQEDIRLRAEKDYVKPDILPLADGF